MVFSMIITPIRGVMGAVVFSVTMVTHIPRRVVFYVMFPGPAFMTPVVMFPVGQCCTEEPFSLRTSALVIFLLFACPFVLYSMTTIASCSGVGPLIVSSIAVAVLVRTAVVVFASSLAAMGLTEGRMRFVTIRVSALLVEAVKFLVTVVTLAVLSAQVPYITMATSSRMGAVMAASTSSL
jgi:hypothetical protein